MDNQSDKTQDQIQQKLDPKNGTVKQSIVCKKCGKIHSIDCYPIINLQYADDAFIKRLFTLDLFKVKCQCGFQFMFKYDCVVIDMFKKHIIYLFTNDSPQKFYQSVEPTLKSILAGNNEFTQTFRTLKHTRLVKDLNDLLQKLLIFDNDLDDGVIQAIKIGLYTKKQIADAKVAALYFEGLDQDKLIFTGIFEDEKSPARQLQVDISSYNAVLENYKFDDLVKRDFQIVDTAFVSKYLINKDAESGEAPKIS